MTMQPVPVATPAPAALRIGLEAGARRPAGDRWHLGIAYDPDFDHLGGQFPEGLTEDQKAGLTPGTLEKVVPDPQASNEWHPYTLWGGERCSVMSGLRNDFYKPKLTNQLSAQTSHLLEETFESGVITLDPGVESYTFADLGYPNRPLASPSAFQPNGTAALGIVPALEIMVEAMADFLGGARGMIHVPAPLLPYLDHFNQVVRNPSDGRFIAMKSHDHVVIAGSGYQGLAPDGSTPAAGFYWIYGTSPVEVRTADIDVVPGSDEFAVHNEQNLIEYRAERLALASWDLSCHVGIQVAAQDPGPAITS